MFTKMCGDSHSGNSAASLTTPAQSALGLLEAGGGDGQLRRHNHNRNAVEGTHEAAFKLSALSRNRQRPQRRPLFNTLHYRGINGDAVITVTLGANSDYFDKVQAVVPGLAARRVYRGDDTLPQSWPGTQQGSAWDWWPGQRVIYSVRPNAAELAAGHLDAQVRTLVATAPPGSCLTSYHEAGSLDHGQKYAELSPRSFGCRLRSSIGSPLIR